MFNPMVGLHFGQNRIPLSFRSVWCPHIQHRCGGILDMAALLWAFAEAVSGTGTFPSGGAPAQLVNHAGGRVGQGYDISFRIHCWPHRGHTSPPTIGNTLR